MQFFIYSKPLTQTSRCWGIENKKAAATPTASLFSGKPNRGCCSLRGLGCMKGGVGADNPAGKQEPYGRRRGSAIETLEGDALSAPIFPAR